MRGALVQLQRSGHLRQAERRLAFAKQIENRKRDDKDLTDLLLFRGLGELGVTGISFRSLRIKGRGVPVAEGGFQSDAAW